MKSKSKHICDWCGKAVYRYPSHLKGKKHIFCSKGCLASFSNKRKNPDGYDSLKDYSHMSEHMSNLNGVLNPKRMTAEIKEKLRECRLGTGNQKTYVKYHGKHEHRIIAEQILGRSLKQGEVVHHLDFNPQNNDANNLLIFPSQAEHAKYHAILHNFFITGKIPNDYAMKEVMPDEVHSP